MTDDYLTAWATNAIGRHSVRLRASVTAHEEYKRQTNAGMYASVTIIAEPADAFAVSVELPPGVLQQMRDPYGSRVARVPGGRYDGGAFLEETIFGVLDILVTADVYPLLGMHLRLVEAAIHPVDSKPYAFRMAGRQVGRRIVAAHLEARQTCPCGPLRRL